MVPHDPPFLAKEDDIPRLIVIVEREALFVSADTDGQVILPPQLWVDGDDLLLLSWSVYGIPLGVLKKPTCWHGKRMAIF